MNEIRVLVTSAGTASAINVIKALRLQRELPIRILAVDADATAPGLYLADDHAAIPKSSDSDYIPELLRLCASHGILALYPIYSKEIEVVAENIQHFIDRDIRLLVSKAEIVRLCNDKRRVYNVVAKLGIHIPRLISDDNIPVFPIFAKPNTASGAQDAQLIEVEADWAYMRRKYPDFLYQEFISGPEYTVDVLCDNQSHLVVASPRLRLATKAGQSVKGKTVHEPRLVNLCATLCKSIGIVGPCNVQFIEHGDEFVFIEVNPRYAAGGLMLTVRSGANLPLLALKLMLGKSILPPKVQGGVMMLRYWDEVFIQQEKG
jgi:carbamoyl-phosphate synthase large subunit